MEPEGEGDRVNLRGKTFEWRGQTLPYFDAAYNTTLKNERAVELPIAWRWLARHLDPDRDGLEVGNVLGHYPPVPERKAVVDQFEKGDGVLNVDLFTVTDRFDWILAISTLEHVRWDHGDRHPLGALHALNHLRSLLNPGGSMLITIPFGSNPGLDAAILLGIVNETWGSTMVRAVDGSWSEQPGPVWSEYGTRTIWANSVWVAEFSRLAPVHPDAAPV
jgi:hypothetical protein